MHSFSLDVLQSEGYKHKTVLNQNRSRSQAMPHTVAINNIFINFNLTSILNLIFQVLCLTRVWTQFAIWSAYLKPWP